MTEYKHRSPCPTCEGCGTPPQVRYYVCGSWHWGPETGDDLPPYDAEPETCQDCDGTGCQHCDDGLIWMTCSHCEASNKEDLLWCGDGELMCEAHLPREYRICQDCYGAGERSHSAVTLEGREWTLTGGSCSLCGSEPSERRDTYPHAVAQARLCDAEGCFYSRLCVGDPAAPGGCLADVLADSDLVPEDRADKLSALSELLAGDDDGLETEMSE